MSTERGEKPRTVLIVDDDERFRATLARAFERRGWEVRQADGLEAALASARDESPEHAVVDLRMRDGDGIDLARELVLLAPATRIVLLTGFGSIASAVESMRAGVVQYLTKPVDFATVIAAFETPYRPDPESRKVPSLDRVQWEHIQRVLQECDGNVSQAARLLGLHRRSLQRKLQRFPPPK